MEIREAIRKAPATLAATAGFMLPMGGTALAEQAPNHDLSDAPDAALLAGVTNIEVSSQFAPQEVEVSAEEAASISSTNSTAKEGIAVASSFGWGNVGGDPLKPGGIHTRQEYVNLVTSDAGRRAMTLLGYDAKARAAWKKAARQGKEVSCDKNTGAHFEGMSYGAGTVSVDRNVTLTDPDYRVNGLPGYCLKFTSGGKTFETFVATVCANVTTVRTRRNHTPTLPKVRKAEIDMTKIAKDTDGKVFPTPTGEFDFTIDCTQNGKPKHRTISYTRPSQVLAACDIGRKFTVTESTQSKTEKAKGTDIWTNETPLKQSGVVKLRNPKAHNGRGQHLVFVNKEIKEVVPAAEIICSGNVTNSGNNNTNTGNIANGNCNTQIITVVPPPEIPPVIPPKELFPPTIEIDQKPPLFEGMDLGDLVTFCAKAVSNPTKNGVAVNFSAIYGKMGPVYVNSEGKFCSKEDTGAVLFPVTDEVVTAIATDIINGKTATDNTGEFPLRQPQ